MNSQHRLKSVPTFLLRVYFKFACLRSTLKALKRNFVFAFIWASLQINSLQLHAWTPWKPSDSSVATSQVVFTSPHIYKVTHNNPGIVPSFPFGNEYIGGIAAGTTGKVLQVQMQEQQGMKSYAVQLKITNSPKEGAQFADKDSVVWVWVTPNTSDIKLKNFRSSTDLFSSLKNGQIKPDLSLAYVPSTQSNSTQARATTKTPATPTTPPTLTRSLPGSTKQSPSPQARLTSTPKPAEITGLFDNKGKVDVYKATYCNIPVTPEYEQSYSCAPRGCDKTRPQVTRFHNLSRDADVNRQKQDNILRMVTAAAKAANINPAVMMSLLDEETIFGKLTEVNKWGDQGIAQFQPGTAIATLDYWRSVGGSNSPVKKIKGPVQFSHGPTNCGTLETGLVPNINCREFSIWLMAFHIKQILSKTNEAARAGVVNDDPVAEMRYIASVYNRGDRVMRSYNASGQKVTAKDYGVLWDVPANGGLKGQSINRCYVYRIAGLCGGLGNSLVGQYTKLFCGRANTTIPGYNNGSVR